MLLMIKSVGSKNISFSSLSLNIIKKFIITIKKFLREINIVVCTAKIFS